MPTYEWTAHYDDAGEMYYYNDKTEESSWEAPHQGGFNPPTESALTTGEDEQEEEEDNKSTTKTKWTKHKDDDGQEFYYNEASEETQWDRPEDYDSEEDGKANDNIVQAAAAESEAPIKEDAPVVIVVVVEMTKEPEENTATKEPANTDHGEASDSEVASKSPAAADEHSSSPAAKKEEEEETSKAKAVEDDGLKKKWIEHTDDEGRVYYYNEETAETQWDKPNDLDVAVGAPVKAATKWNKHTDDDGQVYYYNEASEETQWDKPDDFEEDDEGAEAPEKEKEQASDDEEGASPVHASSPIDTSSPVGTPEHEEPPPDDNSGDDDDDGAIEEATPTENNSAWTKHVDDEGREYYYNEGSGETQWDKPEDLIEEAAVAAAVMFGSKWTKHVDDEGREYYYNESSGETQWDAPADFVADAAATTTTASEDKETPEEKKEETADAVETEPVPEVIEETPKEPEPESEIDPAVKRLQDAENALNQPDAIMEPGCLDNVGELVSSLGGEGGAKALTSLVDSFNGQTAMCGLLGVWLADLKAASNEVEPSKAADQVRDSAEDVINKIAKEKFTKAGGDNIFQLQKSEAVFLEEMMDSSLWRKLLIDLSATHRDSTLLSYCLSSISKRGHHREIAKRINQSDHFPVYSAMLASEFTVVGNGGEAMGMHELLDDLRRTCTSTSYTYLYAVEVLRFLVHKAEESATRDSSLKQAIRKWIRLKEELESAMVDPNVSSKTMGSSSLYRKRRRDVALTVSELHQRQRRRLRPGGVDENGDLRDEQKDALELTLAKLLLRHAEGKKFDDPMLDQLLSQGSNPKEVGRLMNGHPLAIKALLGHLFLPGSSRVSSFTTRSKCAQLIAMAVLAAESATKTERAFEDPATRQAKKDKIKESLLTGSQMCELVENMVSFAVTSEMEIQKGSNPSAGLKLSVLANNSAPVAQGVVMWAKELVSGNEFVGSASYPTLAPNILSLLRIISTRHPFTRPSVLDVALSFLNHSNRELSYQKMNEIKEQALRMLLFLVVQGEICSVLGRVTQRLMATSGALDLDASLVRYFVGGLLDVVSPPCSPLMVTAMGKLLMTTKCVEALQSTYFSEDKKKKLQTLLGMIKLSVPPKSKTNKEATTLVDTLVKTYVGLKQVKA